MISKKFIAAIGAALLISGAPLAFSKSPRRIEIVASRFSYSPNEITLKKGEPVVLVFHSTDVTHGFSLPEMNVRADIKKGKNTEVHFTPSQEGHFVGRCAHFCGNGHGSMALQINVVE